MKIIKAHGQWVAHTKGFDPISRPSTIPFEEEEEAKKDVPQVLSPPYYSTPSSSIDNFTFIKDHYNLLNGLINSLTSSIKGLGRQLHQLQVQQAAIQAQKDAIQAWQTEMQASKIPSSRTSTTTFLYHYLQRLRLTLDFFILKI